MHGDVRERPALVERLRRQARDEARAADRAAAANDPATRSSAASGALERLARFLDADAADPSSAAHRVGSRIARDYARAIGVRRGLLERALDAAARLPTVRVGDAPAAPAGASLPSAAGDPARIVATWLGLGHAYTDGPERDALLGYRDALVEHGYASPEALATGLPGAVCLGVIADLPARPASSAAEPSTRASAGDVDGGDGARKRLRGTLSTLLDLADTLTLAAPERLLELADDHAAHDRAHRARRLLSTRLESAPDDVPCALALARMERARGRLGRARRTLERAIEHRPDDAALGAELARTRRVEGWLDDADEPNHMPAVSLTDGERARGRFDDDTLAAAVELFDRHGTLLVEGAFDPALLDACRAQFLDDYRDYLDDRRHPDALRIGDRRFQVSIRFSGAFNDPRFYANPFVIALMHRLLDPQAIVGSCVCATSLPGSGDQHLHKDHRAPFTVDADDEPMALPAVAVTTMIPLVALDERVGTTLVRKGSHRRARRASERLPEQTPIVPLGSCFFMDLALSHRGQGNSTERVRPIVNMQYTRRWFVDNKNFHRQRPLEIPREEYARIPGEHRSLFDWARQPGPRVDR